MFYNMLCYFFVVFFFQQNLLCQLQKHTCLQHWSLALEVEIQLWTRPNRTALKLLVIFCVDSLSPDPYILMNLPSGDRQNFLCHNFQHLRGVFISGVVVGLRSHMTRQAHMTRVKNRRGWGFRDPEGSCDSSAPQQRH